MKLMNSSLVQLIILSVISNTLIVLKVPKCFWRWSSYQCRLCSFMCI